MGRSKLARALIGLAELEAMCDSRYADVRVGAQAAMSLILREVNRLRWLERHERSLFEGVEAAPARVAAAAKALGMDPDEVTRRLSPHTKREAVAKARATLEKQLPQLAVDFASAKAERARAAEQR